MLSIEKRDDGSVHAVLPVQNPFEFMVINFTYVESPQSQKLQWLAIVAFFLAALFLLVNNLWDPCSIFAKDMGAWSDCRALPYSEQARYVDLCGPSFFAGTAVLLLIVKPLFRSKPDILLDILDGRIEATQGGETTFSAAAGDTKVVVEDTTLVLICARTEAMLEVAIESTEVLVSNLGDTLRAALADQDRRPG